MQAPAALGDEAGAPHLLTLSAAQGWQAAMLSSVVSNAIGFTSYETGLRWYRDAHPGRSPTPMERACIAGEVAATAP